MTPSPTPDPLAAERGALDAVARCAHAQLDALRTGSVERFETAAAQTLRAVSDLDRHQRDRRRSGTAPDAEAVREALRPSAEAAKRACDDLSFALEHAVALGRDLLGLWHPAAAPVAQTYTAAGRLAAADGGRVDGLG